MDRTVINLETGERTVVSVSPEEAAFEASLQAMEDARITYAQRRQAAYPPFSDWLDGMVKGDEAQMRAYVEACLAVKMMYPKPR